MYKIKQCKQTNLVFERTPVRNLVLTGANFEFFLLQAKDKAEVIRQRSVRNASYVQCQLTVCGPMGVDLGMDG